MGWLRKYYGRLEVEDLYQHAILKAYRNASNYRGNCHREARNWVFAILKNLIFDYLRSPWDRYEELDGLSEECLPHQNLDERILDLVLWLKQNLTQREQQIFGLLARGYRQNEIAQELGLSSARVNQVIHETFRKIRNDYLQECDEPPSG